MNRKKVLVTGLGRSGTSAVASVLKNIGFYMFDGEPVPSLEDKTLNGLIKSGQISEIVDRLEARAASNALAGWKDPKLFSDNGTRLLEALGTEWTYIFVYRDPLSIAVRNSITMKVDLESALAEAIRLQRKLYNFNVLAANRCATYRVSYEKFATRFESTVLDLTKFLSIPCDVSMIDDIKKSIDVDHRTYLRNADKTE
jgi:hypothetical protein